HQHPRRRRKTRRSYGSARPAEAAAPKLRRSEGGRRLKNSALETRTTISASERSAVGNSRHPLMSSLTTEYSATVVFRPHTRSVHLILGTDVVGSGGSKGSGGAAGSAMNLWTW